MAGFSQGGGVGLALANWITQGDPGFDVWAMDCARFGDWAGMSYTNAKVRENYSRRFRLTFPNETLPAARPLRTTSLYDRLTHANAVWGVAYGLEQPLWFAPDGMEPEEDVTFARSNAFTPIGEECRGVRTGVAMMETSGFAKYEIAGKGAQGWLSHMLANRMPQDGRLALSPMLNEAGRLIGDFTVAKLCDERFFVFGSGPAETYHMRWFEAHLPDDGSVAVRALGTELVGLSIAGPEARNLLARLTHDDVSATALPFLSFRQMELGMVPAMVGRISFTGDLGYEFWVSPDYLTALFDLAMTEGTDLGLTLFGGRALDSLRLEKSWGTWAREYRPLYTPWEAGLGRFVAEGKNAFIGRDAALRARDDSTPLKLTTFVVDAEGADVWGDEPIIHDGHVAGWVTSGGYAHFCKQSVALGYVKPDFHDVEDGFEIEIMGVPRAASVQATPLFDPDARRMRG
jgi:dimethylglycine dehydrogenase